MVSEGHGAQSPRPDPIIGSLDRIQSNENYPVLSTGKSITFTQDPQWARWSEEMLALHAERDLLAINAIIYAEVSVHFSTQEELEQVVSPDFQRFRYRMMRPF